MEDIVTLGGNPLDRNDNFERPLNGENKIEKERWLAQTEEEIKMTQAFLDIFDPSQINLASQEFINPEIIFGLVLARDPRFFEKESEEQSLIVKQQTKSSIFTFFGNKLSKEIKSDIERFSKIN